MAFKVFDDNSQGTGFVVAVVAIPICVFATVLRFWMARLPGRKIGWEDWFALLALLAFLTYTGCNLWILCHMNGKSVFKLGTLPISTVISIYKAGYVMNIQTALNQTFAKLSLLTLYHRVFNVEDMFRYSVYVVAAIQVAWCIAMVCIRLFLCTPIAATYDPTIKGKCLDSQILLAAGDSINSAIDFVMVGMALFIVLRLQLSLAARLRLSILFIIGGFSGVIGIIKISEAYGTVGSNIHDATWNMAQQGTSIICCCFPIYKPLFKQLNTFQKRVFTFIYSSGTRKTRSTGGSSNSSPQTGSDGCTEKTGRWMQLDGASERKLVKIDDDDAWSREHPPYAIRSITIDQDSETVGSNESQGVLHPSYRGTEV